MSLIAESIKSLLEKKAQLKLLEKEIRELTNTLIAEHNNSGLELLVEDGYQSKISRAVRKTPLIPAITELVGHELPDSCFKMTPYDMVRTEFIGDGKKPDAQLINESES